MEKKQIPDGVLIGELRARLQFAEERNLLLATVANELDEELKANEAAHAAEMIELAKSRDMYRDELLAAQQMLAQYPNTLPAP